MSAIGPAYGAGCERSTAGGVCGVEGTERGWRLTSAGGYNGSGGSSLLFVLNLRYSRRPGGGADPP